MARIRTIKPDFMDSSDTQALSRDARLFFLQLLTEVDDKGRLIYSPKRLAGVLYPNDEDVDGPLIEKWALECAVQGMVLFYRRTTVGLPESARSSSQRLLHVPNFLRHQRVNNPTPSKLPAAPWEEDFDGDTYPEQEEWAATQRLPEFYVNPTVALTRKSVPEEEREEEVGKGRGSGKQSPEGLMDDPKALRHYAAARKKASTRIIQSVIASASPSLTSGQTNQVKRLTKPLDEWLNAGWSESELVTAIAHAPSKSENSINVELGKRRQEVQKTNKSNAWMSSTEPF